MGIHNFPCIGAFAGGRSIGIHGHAVRILSSVTIGALLLWSVKHAPTLIFVNLSTRLLSLLYLNTSVGLQFY